MPPSPPGPAACLLSESSCADALDFFRPPARTPRSLPQSSYRLRGPLTTGGADTLCLPAYDEGRSAELWRPDPAGFCLKR